MGADLLKRLLITTYNVFILKKEPPIGTYKVAKTISPQKGDPYIMKYTFPSEQDAFLNANNLLNRLTEALKSQKWLNAEHGQVEKMINKDGFEIMRLLLQGNLNERARLEPDLSSEMMNKGEQKYKRAGCTRFLNSVFGKVVVRRKGYIEDECDTIFPQDGQLNLSKDSYSDGLRIKAAQSVSDLSFEKSTENILKCTASSVPKRQMINVIRHISQDFDAFYKTRDVMDCSESGILVLTCDAKGIVMRQSDLREVTQKAAKAEKHKKQTRLSRGEKRNRKRMSMVASVYDIDPHIRTAKSIMGLIENESGPPKPRNKRVWASVEKSSNEVIQNMFDEAFRRDPQQKRKWVILIDGQVAQLKAVKKVMKKMKVRATIIMDFVHVLEYLWKAAYCFHEESSQAAENWVMNRTLRILNGEASWVAAGIRRSCTKLRLRKKQRKNADICADYILKRKAYLKYDVCLTTGFPIATGVIEGACRYLVKDRLDITGARWGLYGAEAVLKIRAIITSNDFEAYFKFHKQQEQLRNYPYFESISYKMAA